MHNIHFNFSDCLTDAPFSSSNYVRIDERYQQWTSIRINPSEITEIPICMVPQFEKAVQERKMKDALPLVYQEGTYFRGRKLTAVRFIDIIDDIIVPFTHNINGTQYILGKGFIGVVRTGYIEYLFMITAEVTEDRKVVKSNNNCKIYVSPKLKTEHKSIYTIIEKEFLREFTGDVTFTANMSKYFGTRIKLPKFDTVSEQDRFLKGMFHQTLTSLAA